MVSVSTLTEGEGGQCLKSQESGQKDRLSRRIGGSVENFRSRHLRHLTHHVSSAGGTGRKKALSQKLKENSSTAAVWMENSLLTGDKETSPQLDEIGRSIALNRSSVGSEEKTGISIKDQRFQKTTGCKPPVLLMTSPNLPLS